MSKHDRKRNAIRGGLAILLAAASVAFAQQAGKHNDKSRADAADEKSPPGQSSQAGIDASGRLRPLTNDEARELLAGISRFVDQSAEGLTPVRHASGMLTLDLDDRFQSVSLARLGTDGGVALRCIGTPAEAKQFLGATTRTGALMPPRVAPNAPTAPRMPAFPLEEK